MKHRLLFVLAALLICLVVSPLRAQIREVALDERIDAAALIVEGTVVKSTPFAVPEQARIYTAHAIRVSRVLKAGGADPAGLMQVEFVTPGGQVDGELHVVTPSLHPQVGERGVFFLETRPGYAGRQNAWVPIASVQGFVRYTPAGARDSFQRYDDRTRDLFEPIARRSGEQGVVVQLQPDDPGPALQGGVIISDFSPGTIRAGIQEILTITGSGFGTYTGTATVLFDNADDGPFGPSGPVDDEHVLSWTDNEIQVYVPNRNGGVPPGTGRFTVRGSSGSFQASATELVVEYAIKEIRTGGQLFRLNLIDEDQRGGYTFRYGTSTATAGVDITSIPGAVERFEEAFETWSCATGWSIDTDGTTTVQSPGNDGVNIIAFDSNGDALPAGIIGRTSSFFSSCGGDTWFVSGLDIRMRRNGTGVNWYYDADPGSLPGFLTDFASVAMHEIGHTLQLGHVNDSDDAMYFSIPPGSAKRTPSPAALAGASDVLSYSASFGSCGKGGTLPFDCGSVPDTEFIYNPAGSCGTSVDVDFVDTSHHGPSSWVWSFGDGTISNERNPQHHFAPAGLYTVSLTASNDNGSKTEEKTNAVVVADAPIAASCSASFSGHSDCCSIGIFNVSLNTIDQTSLTPSEGDPLEEDFTCSQLTVLEAGGSYPLSIVTGPANNENVRVYVDWNGSGVLEGTELAFESLNEVFHSGDLSVPAGAMRDTALRMRVLSDWFMQGIFSSCENIEFGQTEDYSVMVVDPPPPPPGRVPDASLRINKDDAAFPGNIGFSWDPSCSPAATDYSIYQGNLGNWTSHTQRICSTGGATIRNNFNPGNPSRYYLVVPNGASGEGSYGVDSSGVERPPAVSTCNTPQVTTACQ